MVNEAAKAAVKEALPLTVLYDSECPLCRREIGVYRGQQPLHSDLPVCFADANRLADVPAAVQTGDRWPVSVVW